MALARRGRGEHGRRVPAIGCVVVNSPGWPAVQESFLNADVFWKSLPDARRDVLGQRPAVPDRRGPHPRLRARCSRSCGACRGPCSSRCGCSRPSTSTCSGPCRASSSSSCSASGSRRLRSRRRARSTRSSGRSSPSRSLYSAYVSEVYRAGIDSVHPSQDAAARSLGLTHAPDDAARRGATGRPPRDPAAAQRLHRPPEGHRPRLVHRRGRDLPDGRRSQVAANFNFTPYVRPRSSLVVIIPLARFPTGSSPGSARGLGPGSTAAP